MRWYVTLVSLMCVCLCGRTAWAVPPGAVGAVTEPTVESVETTDLLPAEWADDTWTHHPFDLYAADTYWSLSPGGERVLVFFRGLGRWVGTVFDRKLRPVHSTQAASSIFSEPSFYWCYNDNIWADSRWERQGRSESHLLCSGVTISSICRQDVGAPPVALRFPLEQVLSLRRECALPAPMPGGGFLVWLPDSGEIWYISPKESDRRKVVQVGGKLIWMAASPSGKLFAFASGDYSRSRMDFTPYGIGTITVRDSTTGELVQEVLDVSRCDWHPLRDALVYERGGDVWEVAAPGWQPRKLLLGAERAVVSPDGRWIAYMVPGEEGVWVRAYESVGQEGTKLTSFGSTPFWLNGTTIGMKRRVTKESLEAGTEHYIAFATVKLKLPSGTATDAPKGEERIQTQTFGIAALGAVVKPLTDTLKKVYEAESGVFVERLEPGSPASLAGMKSEDIIEKYAGIRVRLVEDLVKWVEDTDPGTPVEVGVLRDGKRITLRITLGRRDGGGQEGVKH